MIPPALFRKAWADVRVLLISVATLVFLFAMTFVVLTQAIDAGVFLRFIESFSENIKRLLVVPPSEIVTPRGMVGIVFAHPFVFLCCVVWAVTRGSDAICGQLANGVLESILAQPISRLQLFVVDAIATAIGALGIIGALLGGVAVGIAVRRFEHFSVLTYMGSALNLLCLTLCVAGIATAVSAFDQYRWRSIGIVGVFLAVELALKVFSQMWVHGGWLGYLTILTCFEPQIFCTDLPGFWYNLAVYNATLLGIALLSYGCAAVVFSYRDLPAAI